MTPLAKKIEVDCKMRDLLEREGLPPPDRIEYGYQCVRLFWTESMVCLVIDIEDDIDIDGLRDIAAELETESD